MNFRKSTLFCVGELPIFNATGHFIRNTHPVTIRFLGQNFQRLLRVSPRHETCYYVAKTLVQEQTCNDFLDHFGRKSFVSLSVVWHLLTLQPSGEKEGFLLADGRANIFVVSVDDSVFSVGVSWFEGTNASRLKSRGWNLGAHPRIPIQPKKERRWFAGTQIITRVEP